MARPRPGIPSDAGCSAATTLRARKSSDLARIVAWVPDAEALYLFTGPRLVWPLSEKQLVDLEQTPGLSAWVLVDPSVSDEPIGHVDITLSRDVAHIGRVIVDPVRRGEGLGAVLAGLALKKARELGAFRVGLNVIEGNLPAIRVYERLGFVPEGKAERSDVLSMVATRDA